MIGDREQIESIPLRLNGQPRRTSCPADINAIPGTQRTAEQHSAIWHLDVPLGSGFPGYRHDSTAAIGRSGAHRGGVVGGIAGRNAAYTAPNTPEQPRAA